MGADVSGGADARRCRLCTANDHDGLIEHVAAAMWERRRHGTLDDRPWPEAGPYWQSMFRDLAGEAVNAMAHDPADA